MSEDPNHEAGVSTRWPELIVALLLAAIGVVVITDSLRVGAGWGDDGPRAGYFPFYIGLVLLLSSAWIALQQLLRWRRLEAFATRSQVISVATVLVPMAVYVAAVKPLGIYVASALLIGWFMARLGKHKAWLTVLIAVGVPLVFFVVFERWFLVPLPKGPIENWLGF